MVLEAMIDKQHIGGALLFASDELRKNRRFIMESVMQNGEALKHASEDLRAYRAVVMAAVKQSGWALEYASAKSLYNIQCSEICTLRNEKFHTEI